MANAIDVAEYILASHGPMSAWKLQKLVYYSQAWHIVWDDECLFDERIEAWANGPVVPALYDRHRGQFRVKTVEGDPSNLRTSESDSIDAVLSHYGDKSPQWLSDLTHLEAPWKKARAGISPGERSNREITPSALAEYYGSLETK